MERRKFVIGLGALASGTAAAVGTGAFNIARVDRDMNVEIVNDSDAYLALKETDGEYTEVDGEDNDVDTLSIDFGENSEGGKGLSENANYVFTDVFKVVNQGTDTIAFELDDDEEGPINWDTTYPRAYGSYDELGTTNDVNGDVDFNEVDGTAAGAPVLEPGDEFYIHFEFVGRDAETDDDGRDEVPNTIGIYAEAVENEGEDEAEDED